MKRLINFFKFENTSPLKFFVITAALFGLAMLFITPPFEAPDEPVHFMRSYQVSQLNLSVDKIGSTYGGHLPQSLQDTITETWDKPALAFHPDRKYPLGDTKAAFSIKTTNKQHVYDFSTTAYYSPVSYIPQAVGIDIARLLHLPAIMMMYLGRLVNLSAWIAMFGLAIYLIPRRKWLMVFIGLIPMALFQAASLSADVMAVGLLAILVAWILRLMESRDKLSTKQIIGLTLLIAGVSLSKQIMFLFIPLALLLPRKLFASKNREYVFKAVIALVPLLLFGLWSLHVHGIPQSNSVNGIDPVGQEKFVLHHPLSYVNTLSNSYLFSWGDGIVKSFIGEFGWVDTPLAEGFVVSGYLAMFILAFGNYGTAKAWLTRRQKFFIGIIALAYVVALSTALYVYFTPVGFRIIVGLVGRYYFPVALLAIPLTYGNWLKVSQTSYRRVATWAPLFLLVCSTLTIFVRYYITNV